MLPFPDFSSFVAWIVLEEELIELRNTFLPPCCKPVRKYI